MVYGAYVAVPLTVVHACYQVIVATWVIGTLGRGGVTSDDVQLPTT